MTVKFVPREIPVATSMIKAARRLRKRKDGYHPFEKYVYYWTAFNNIYHNIAYLEGEQATYKKDKQGNIKTTLNGSVSIPAVKPVEERKQIELAINQFDNVLKHQLIMHDSTRFFVYRTPCWEEKSIQKDINGQTVNGVINVNYTTDSNHPVWSPIDVEAYNNYINNQNDNAARNLLAKQIVFLLYTVRNNLLHAGKRIDDTNDTEVVEKATPLLATIVSAFRQGQ